MPFSKVQTLDDDEFDVLSFMTPDTKKFVIPLGAVPDQGHQDALERLMMRDWIRLIDVSPAPTSGRGLYRIFRVMPEAVEWFNSFSRETN